MIQEQRNINIWNAGGGDADYRGIHHHVNVTTEQFAGSMEIQIGYLALANYLQNF